MQRTIRQFRNALAIAAMLSVVPAGAASAMPVIDPPQHVVSSSTDWDRVVAGIQREIDAAVIPVETAPVVSGGDDVSVIIVLLIGGGALLTGAVAGFGGGRVVARRQLAS